MTIETMARLAEPCNRILLGTLQILAERGELDPKHLADARNVTSDGDASALLTHLTRKKQLDPARFLQAVCKRRRIVNYLDVGGIPLLPRPLRMLTEKRATDLGVLPTITIREEGTGMTLLLATESLPGKTTDELRRLLHCDPVPLITTKKDLRNFTAEAFRRLHESGSRDPRLGEILLRDGMIDAEDLEEGIERAQKRRIRIGDALVEGGAVSEHDVYAMISAQRGLPFRTAEEVLNAMDNDLVGALPTNFLKHNRLVPYQRQRNTITAVASDPLIDTMPLLQILNAERVQLELIAPSDLTEVLKRIEAPIDFEFTEADDKPIDMSVVEEETYDPTDAESHQYLAMADRILASAVHQGASDIHIEIYSGMVYVRFRIDGRLQDMPHLRIDPTTLRGVLNVFKIRSGIDIAERRLPQGGRMRSRTSDGKVFDFRVQTQSSLHGEHVVIRILSQSSKIVSLQQLGFSDKQTTVLNRLMKNPSGLVLVTGPTGSGKTTTLYSMLNTLRQDSHLKIVTVEDPIEYSLDRVQQCQVIPSIGFGFASAIRSFLRQDPDIILVGEIRDTETAIEAVRSSQTGHLVFSTLHTNDAVDAIQRLRGLDLDAPSIGSELIMILAQRLARRICGGCREAYHPSPEVLAELFPRGYPAGTTFTRGAGCSLCNRTGYRDRVAIVETWPVEEEVRDLIMRDARAAELRKAAHETGIPTMVDDACAKVLAGLTTVEEILRIVPYAKIRSDHRMIHPSPDAADRETG